jgi:hypothetical protein
MDKAISSSVVQDNYGVVPGILTHFRSYRLANRESRAVTVRPRSPHLSLQDATLLDSGQILTIFRGQSLSRVLAPQSITSTLFWLRTLMCSSENSQL